MTASEKNNKIKLLKEDIVIFNRIVDSNPSDTLSKDILFFKKRQLEEIELTPTEEELKSEISFNRVLKRQEEKVTSVKNNENKVIKDIVIYFNSDNSFFEVKYNIDGKSKSRTYPFDKEFLNEAEYSYEKLSNKYGEEMSNEYDKIIYGVLSKLDSDLGTKVLTEFLNNNKTFIILYDFRNFSNMKRKFKKIIEKSYKKNSNKSNVHVLRENTKENEDLYNSIMKKSDETKKFLQADIVPFSLNNEEKIKDEKVVPLKIDMLKQKEELVKLKLNIPKEEKDEIEVLDETSNNMSLNEIFKEEQIEVLDEEPRKRVA